MKAQVRITACKDAVDSKYLSHQDKGLQTASVSQELARAAWRAAGKGGLMRTK